MNFTSGVSYTFPNVALAPNNYLVVTDYPDAFHFRYPSVTNYVAGADLLLAGASAKAYVPTSAALGSTWTSASFSDSTWTSGTTGVGYDNSGTVFPGLINLNVGGAMYNRERYGVPAGDVQRVGSRQHPGTAPADEVRRGIRGLPERYARGRKAPPPLR